ncbi:MAG: DUF4846 domain-containing protein [Calditrichaceae bacterium]
MKSGINSFDVKTTVKLAAILFIFLNSSGLFGQIRYFDPKTYGLQKFDTMEERFPVPANYERLQVEKDSFADYLRNLPLLPGSTAVLDYRGKISVKSGDTTLAAVTAIDIAGRNLEQCMDILLRVRAEFLWTRGLKEQINFPLPDGLTLSWKQWAKGDRPEFAGLHFFLKRSSGQDSSRGNLENYLRVIFEYSGTQTFYHFYKDIPANELQIGDFIVKKGRKGHAVMIMDLARNKDGNLVALIAQGDTPACQLYILKNQKNEAWFPIDFSQKYLPLPIKKKMGWDGLRRFDK